MNLLETPGITVKESAEIKRNILLPVSLFAKEVHINVKSIRALTDDAKEACLKLDEYLRNHYLAVRFIHKEYKQTAF